MRADRWEPLFIAAWDRVLMVHFEVDAALLQEQVPFPLDLWHGRAFVSLVMFTMRGMRPYRGGKMAASLFRPIATHDFLNVRTYVTMKEGTGIHFLAEWLSNRLAVKLGPITFGLPYRFGQIAYQHNGVGGVLAGRVADGAGHGGLAYRANMPAPATLAPCEPGSLDEWLMERYIAYNSAGGRRRFFRVWHPPWEQVRCEAVTEDQTLLTQRWPWFSEAKLVGANACPGLDEVWLGRPHGIEGS